MCLAEKLHNHRKECSTDSKAMETELELELKTDKSLVVVAYCGYILEQVYMNNVIQKHRDKRNTVFYVSPVINLQSVQGLCLRSVSAPLTSAYIHVYIPTFWYFFVHSCKLCLFGATTFFLCVILQIVDKWAIYIKKVP